MSKLVVSLGTAALALGVASGICFAGDKIQFTVPGNPVTDQKPEREARTLDDTQAQRFNPVPPPPASYIETPPVVVMAPEKNKRGDRNNRDDRNGLRAWDSGMKSFGADQQDDLLGADAKPASRNAATNDYNAKLEWEPGSTGLRAQDRFEDFTGFSSHRSVAATQSGSDRRGGVSDLLSGPTAMADGNAQNAAGGESMDRSANADGLSAWSRTMGSTHGSYSERMQAYSSMFDPATLNGGNSDNGAKAGTTPSAADLNNPMLNSSLQNSRDNTDLYGTRNQVSGSLYVGATASSSKYWSGNYSHFSAADAGISSQSPTPTRPTLAAPVNPGVQLRAPIGGGLPWPKQPGSLFQ